MNNFAGAFRHQFKRQIVLCRTVIIFGFLFFAYYTPAQEVPCFSLRSEMKFVNVSDPAATAECRNLRRRRPAAKTNSGEDNFTIAGQVRHTSGVPMTGVMMTLKVNNQVTRTVVTENNGTYYFDDLQIVDNYELKPSKEGYTFTPPVITGVIVRDVVQNFTASGPPPPPPPTPANQPTLAWTSYYDNPLPAGSTSGPNADYSAMMARDAQGNVYVAGTSFVENFNKNGNTDISIYKTDANGNRLWARTFNGPRNYKDGAVDLAVDPAGNAYIAGFADVSTGSGSDYDYVVLKYDPDGNLLWSKYYSGNGGEDVPRSIKVDAAGNAYVTGYSWGLYANYATVKYDTNGNQMWARRYVGGFGELATEVEVDASGNVYVTGYSGHSVAGDAEDFLTVKYSPTGEQLWVNRYNAPPGDRNEQAHEMEINSAGDVFVMGLSDNFANAHTVIQKINGVSGTTVWTKNFNVSANADLEDSPFAMKLAPDGSIILAGHIIDFDNDNLDAYVAKFDPQGVLQWSKIYDGPGLHDYDADTKLALDAQGNIYIGVTSEGFANYDLQIIKYLPDGVIDWTYRFDNPFFSKDIFIKWIDDNAQTNISVDEDGNVYVAGESIIPGQAFNLVAFKLEPVAQRRAVPFDFDGDKKADIAVFRPETGVWYIEKSSDGSHIIIQWGLENDKLVPADYDGDGLNDPAVYRDGIWYVMKSSDGSILFRQFGLAEDVPIPADFDNDGRADLSVFRQGIWHQLTTSNNSYKAFQFGLSGDTPLPSDYDRNRRSDAAVYRGGVWYVSYQAELPFNSYQYGIDTDRPVPADYDGDGQTDYAVFRSGTWYIRQSRTDSNLIIQWGIESDIPVPADYDGDRKTDLAVFRDGVWYILRSSDNTYKITQFGLKGDVPIPSAYLR